MPKTQSDSVYRIIDVVGVSETSWEDAGRKAGRPPPALCVTSASPRLPKWI